MGKSAAKTAKQPLDGSARERLLAAANELFYEEGVHTVGIDRVIERAGVAKASLYSTFGSKDELIHAYLESRFEARKARIARRLARHPSPRERLLAVFDHLAEVAAEPGFRGCAFLNASAEGAEGGSAGRAADRVRKVARDSRAWLRGLFTDLAREAGVRDPEALARQLTLLYDGATVAASIERDAAAPRAARATAVALLDAARV